MHQEQVLQGLKMELVHYSYKPSPQITALSNKSIPLNNKVIIEELVLKFPDNLSSSVYLVKPMIDGVFPGIVFLHWLEPHAENSNKDEFLPMAIKLAENHNIVSILPDAFWSTTPEKYKEQPHLGWITEYDNDSKLIERQLLKLLYAIDYLESLSSVKKEEIYFCGHDFGAMFGTLLGTFKQNIKGYVLMALTGKFSDWFRFGNKLDKVENFLEYVKKMSKYDPVSNVSNIKQKVFFQFALNDFYIPVEKAIALTDKVKDNKNIMWYKAGHGMNDQSFADAEAWLVNLVSS